MIGFQRLLMAGMGLFLLGTAVIAGGYIEKNYSLLWTSTIGRRCD